MKSHEIALIDKAASGDEQAVADLYKIFEPRFKQFASDFLHKQGGCAPAQHCGEVMSAACEKIFNRDSLAKLWSPYNFEDWAQRIIINCCWDHLKQCWRRQKHEVPFDSLTHRTADESGDREIQFDPPSSDPPLLAGRGDVLFCGVLINEVFVMTAGPDFPAKFHEILRLQLEEDLDLLSIAKRVEEPYGNVRSIYSRGMKKLMEELGVERKKEMKKRLTRKKTEEPNSGS